MTIEWSVLAHLAYKNIEQIYSKVLLELPLVVWSLGDEEKKFHNIYTSLSRRRKNQIIQHFSQTDLWSITTSDVISVTSVDLTTKVINFFIFVNDTATK